jgi:RNA-binding protein
VTLTSKQRAALRGEAHHLNPIVHVGQQGITAEVVRALDDALRTQELVKIQLTKGAALDVREAAADLAAATGAEVVQTIGRTAALYRHNPDLTDSDRRRR